MRNNAAPQSAGRDLHSLAVRRGVTLRRLQPRGSVAIGRPDVPDLRRWADLAEFCIEASGDELVDALVMLAEGLEAALEEALVAGKAPL